MSNEEQQGRTLGTLGQLLHWSGSQRGRGDEADQKLEQGGKWLKTKGEQCQLGGSRGRLVLRALAANRNGRKDNVKALSGALCQRDIETESTLLKKEQSCDVVMVINSKFWENMTYSQIFSEKTFLPEFT